jgi:four helix bundle protein
MARKSILKEKSFAFAIRVINLYKYLKKEQTEYIISRQLLRAGTSIGAIICEAEFAESKQDFIHKLALALKEANEVLYWLALLKETNYLTIKMYLSISKDAREITGLLVASIKTLKHKYANKSS